MEPVSSCCLSIARICRSRAHSWFVYGCSSRLLAALHQLPLVSRQTLYMAMPHASASLCTSALLHGHCHVLGTLLQGSSHCMCISLLPCPPQMPAVPTSVAPKACHVSSRNKRPRYATHFGGGAVLHRLKQGPGPCQKDDRCPRQWTSYRCVMQVPCCSSGHSRVLRSCPELPRLPTPALCTALAAALLLHGVPHWTLETRPQVSCFQQVGLEVCTAVSHVLLCRAVLLHSGRPFTNQASDSDDISLSSPHNTAAYPPQQGSA